MRRIYPGGGKRWTRIVDAWSALVRQALDEGWSADRLDAALAEVRP